MLKQGKENIHIETPSPLNICIRKGDFTSLRFLLESGAEIFKTHDNDKIPFISLIENGYCEIVKEILAVGSPILKEGPLFAKFLVAAIHTKNEKMITLLLEVYQKNFPKNNFKSLLIDDKSINMIAQSLLDAMTINDKEMLQIFSQLLCPELKMGHKETFK